MKLKDYLKKVNDQAKINNEDANKVFESLPDTDIPDVWVNLFNESFLTRERAEADPKISQKIKAETLNAVDANIKKVLPVLTEKDREEIEKEPSSYKKIELLEKAIGNALTKAKSDNPNTEEKVKQLEKNVQEFADKVTAVQRQKDDEIKTIKAQHEQEKSGLKLDWTLDKKLGEFTFADEFTSLKPAIIKTIVDTVKSQNTLHLDDKGQIVVVEIDEATKVAKPKFNGNDPVTIDSLLVEPVKPFLKKNNAGGDDGKGKREQPKQRTTPPDVDRSKMTLQEMRAARFAEAEG